VVLIKTDYGKIVGGYMPDKWENTVISSSNVGGSGKTFVFYQND